MLESPLEANLFFVLYILSFHKCIKKADRRRPRLNVSKHSASLPQPHARCWQTFHQDEWQELRQKRDKRGRRSAWSVVSASRIKFHVLLCLIILLHCFPCLKELRWSAAVHRRGGLQLELIQGQRPCMWSQRLRGARALHHPCTCSRH